VVKLLESSLHFWNFISTDVHGHFGGLVLEWNTHKIQAHNF